MRKTLAICSLAIAAAIAAAPAEAVDKTTLRFFTIFDAPAMESWQPVIDAFKAANPDIDVKVETVAGSGAAVYPDVLRTSMASGDPADLFFMWGGEIAGPFIRAGQVRPVDDYYGRYKWKDRFANWIVALACRRTARLTAFPTMPGAWPSGIARISLTSTA